MHNASSFSASIAQTPGNYVQICDPQERSGFHRNHQFEDVFRPQQILETSQSVLVLPPNHKQILPQSWEMMKTVEKMIRGAQ